MGLGGLEPPTSRLSGGRSNQLSYRPQNLASRRRIGPDSGRREIAGPGELDALDTPVSKN